MNSQQQTALSVRATLAQVKKPARRALSGFGIVAAAAALSFASAMAIDANLRSKVFFSPWMQDTFAFEIESLTIDAAVKSVDFDEVDALQVKAEPRPKGHHMAVIKNAKPGVQTKLTAGQRQVAHYISKRYRVSRDAIESLVKLAWKVGKEEGVEPTLILAISGIESSYNPYAASSVGAKGLMQVMAHIHKDKFEKLSPGDWSPLNPELNMRVGAQIIKEYTRRGGSVENGLRWYVGAAIHGNDGGYPQKVLGLKVKIDAAYREGKVLAAKAQSGDGKLSAIAVNTPQG